MTYEEAIESLETIQKQLEHQGWDRDYPTVPLKKLASQIQDALNVVSEVLSDLNNVSDELAKVEAKLEKSEDKNGEHEDEIEGLKDRLSELEGAEDDWKLSSPDIIGELYEMEIA